MAEKKRVVVAGARGVFGSLLCAELEDAFDVVRTSRTPAPGFVPLDVNDVSAVASAVRGAFAFACAAGPFQLLDRKVVRAVVEEGVHWLDIADDEDWFFDVYDDRILRAAAEDVGVSVLPGLSTLPAISGALVRSLGAPPHVEIILRIGNRNRKGAAAIASGAALRTPDRDLLFRELKVSAEVRTEFQMPGAAALLRLLSTFPPATRLKIAKAIAPIATRLRLGTPGGSVRVLTGAGSAEVVARDQRLAILPVAYALEHMPAAGVQSPLVFPHEPFLEWIRERA
jgi:hypothetical protein